MTLGLCAVADRIALSVADDGAGMSPAQIERLFVPFAAEAARRPTASASAWSSPATWSS